jgi:predicted translin family RNA/ssDNA-binding protein
LKLKPKHDKKERIYKQGRDIVIQSKRMIFSLHRFDGKNSEEIFPLVEESFKKIEILLQNIQKEIEINENFYHLFYKSFQFSIEEYVEGISFYFYLKNGKLISLEEINEFSKFQITLEQYLLGICDLTGELMKYTTNLFNDGNRKTPLSILEFLHKIYICFLSISYEFPNLKEKLTVMLNSLEKVERLCYEIKLK